MREENLIEWLQRRPLFLDIPLALFFSLIYFASGPQVPYAIAGILMLGLALRRSHPAWSFGLVSVALAIRIMDQSQILPSDFVFLVAMYSLGAYEKRRGVRLAGVGVALLGSILGGLRFSYVQGFEKSLSAVVFSASACFGAALAAWALGELKRNRLRLIADLQDRAERIEREREQELKFAAQQERASIAREMHDVVAHALSVIVVQSDGAAYAAERRPEQSAGLAVAALNTIGVTAREALTETRRLVGVLRDPDSGAELAPTGGLGAVDDLVERIRAAGVNVSLERTGDEVQVPVGVDMAAYRVIQEALTNVIKHAGRHAEARVVIDQAPEQLRISVTDNGIGAGAVTDGHGHGLHGMRERVSVHEGVLTAGPLPGRGFEVRATLPLEAKNETINGRFRRNRSEQPEGTERVQTEKVSTDD